MQTMLLVTTALRWHRACPWHASRQLSVTKERHMQACGIHTEAVQKWQWVQHHSCWHCWCGVVCDSLSRLSGPHCGMCGTHVQAHVAKHVDACSETPGCCTTVKQRNSSCASFTSIQYSHRPALARLQCGAMLKLEVSPAIEQTLQTTFLDVAQKGQGNCARGSPGAALHCCASGCSLEQTDQPKSDTQCGLTPALACQLCRSQVLLTCPH